MSIAESLRKRGALKTKLTNTVNFLDDLQKGEITVTKILYNELKSRSVSQEGLLSDFNKTQSFIEIKCDEQDLESNYKERDWFETNYHRSVGILDSLLEQFSKTEGSIRDTSETEQGQSDNVAIAEDTNAFKTELKLPTINLPIFSGSYTNWLEFRDLFISLIHESKSISKIQKFHYLRASLEGPAAQIIKSIEFSAQNYDTAWELLCNRYHNSHLLVHNHIKAIFELSCITKDCSAAYRQMVDEVSKHLRSLDILQSREEIFDALIVYILLNKLDIKTTREWEMKNQGNSVSLTQFKHFLKNKADVLETLESRAFKSTEKRDHTVKVSKFKSFSLNVATCNYCKQAHTIYNCTDFLNLSADNKIEQAKCLNLCYNCLRTGHGSKTCTSGNCRKCKGRHNTLLHRDSRHLTTENVTNNSTFSACTQIKGQVLLATVQVVVHDRFKKPHLCRAMLDSGSQSNFMTMKLCNKLGLQKTNTSISIMGLNHVTSNIKHECNALIKSRNGSFQANISMFVVETISGSLNSCELDLSMLKLPSNITLADPQFGSGEIDLLFGGDLFWRTLQDGKLQLGTNKPILQNTQFGWVIAGSLELPSHNQTLECHFSRTVDIHKQLQRFWEIEEYTAPFPSIETKECEDIFERTTYRNSEGRFVVTIPFKQNPAVLGTSREQALKRLLNLETRFEKQPQFRNMYVSFMQEYEKLGHMSKSDCDDSGNGYYLPHHGVYKEDSLTSKLRVVFDGSTITSNGISLNDIQHTGPNMQQDLLSILIRFREHQYVFTADVSKMYRQIEVRKEDRQFQKILWRPNRSQDIQEYKLNTVTYGTRAAPYLAIRCVKQLAIESAEKYPQASEVIGRDFYVDDLISGCQDIELTTKLTREISFIMKSGCFELRKWSTNYSEVLSEVDIEKHSSQLQGFKEDKCKTLGLQWASKTDNLSYSIKGTYHSIVTKRSVLSEVSQIFDPLGLLAPCIIVIKVLLQQLWTFKLSWDEQLPYNLQQQWNTIRQDLTMLNDLKIKRHVLCKDFTVVQLHGFCDSSQKAYGSCIYARTISSNGEIYVNLVCAKTKVAPLKALTIPRLELCGALLLARLMTKVKEAMTVEIKCYYWTNSQIVLAWLNSESTMLQTFVSNRVSEIQTITDGTSWNYVSTNENPADLLSRGIKPCNIMQSSVWWYASDWLSKNEEFWPSRLSKTGLDDIPELKRETISFVSQTTSEFDIFERYSSFKKLQRITALCYRFINNCRNKKKQLGVITARELEVTATKLVRLAQQQVYFNEFQVLTNSKLKYNGNLLSLTPFVDKEGIIRVGGRLANSSLEYNQKHQAILPARPILSTLIFRDIHESLLHGGPQLMLFTSRERYWITGGRTLARKIVRTCVTCFKVKPASKVPIMGDLPLYRVRPALPFSVSGTDFAGPFYVRERLGRGVRKCKCYVCIFICMTTKAVHVEPVSDLTTDSFMSILKRFIARRGKPSHLISDNRTTFVKASKELSELGKYLLEHNKQLTDKSATEGITWSFIAPVSPNFGGLWESAVKSMKHHLRRVLINQCLTFEKFLTLLVMIEGILNSRPICPMSNDPNDYSSLTPGHFLIGRPIVSLPEHNVENVKQNRLTIHKQFQQLRQQFWRRWSREYLTQLQVRSKWTKNPECIVEGALVLLRDESLPSTQWRLGRVISRHPGPDGVTRVVTVKTANGVFRRAVSKVCPLPLEPTTEMEPANSTTDNEK